MAAAGGESEGTVAPERVEAEGSSVGEAKHSALQALQARYPGLDGECVEFEVLEEEPARVSARADLDAWRARSEDLPDEPAERIRAVVARVTQALDLGASVDMSETDEEIRATVNGEDLGLLIGKHGVTIDALQHLASRVAFRGEEERKRVVVDAAGYRERREAGLRRAADRAVEDAISFGRPVELEPMTAAERKAVHMYLRERTDVETHSEGDEPDRRLVVSPVQGIGA